MGCMSFNKLKLKPDKVKVLTSGISLVHEWGLTPSEGPNTQLGSTATSNTVLRCSGGGSGQGS